MNTIRRLALLLLTLCLAACAGSTSFNQQKFTDGGSDYFPGGSMFYNFGQGQSFENFENVARAQSSFRLFTKDRTWQDIKPSKYPVGNIGSLQGYIPLDVRWRLKDGREFILEQIDLRAIMREYFKTNTILLQHQIEKREKVLGDYTPDLLHEIKDDTVIIKWQLIVNRTPVSQRSTDKGVTLRWDTVREHYFVTAIKGKPTSGIDFDKRWETNK